MVTRKGVEEHGVWMFSFPSLSLTQVRPSVVSTSALCSGWDHGRSNEMRRRGGEGVGGSLVQGGGKEVGGG
jgi:hypothetical protein